MGKESQKQLQMPRARHHLIGWTFTERLFSVSRLQKEFSRYIVVTAVPGERVSDPSYQNLTWAPECQIKGVYNGRRALQIWAMTLLLLPLHCGLINICHLPRTHSKVYRERSPSTPGFSQIKQCFTSTDRSINWALRPWLHTLITMLRD